MRRNISEHAARRARAASSWGARDSDGDPLSARSSSENSTPCSRAASILYPGQASLLCASLLLPVTPEFAGERQSLSLRFRRPVK